MLCLRTYIAIYQGKYAAPGSRVRHHRGCSRRRRQYMQSKAHVFVHTRKFTYVYIVHLYAACSLPIDMPRVYTEPQYHAYAILIGQ